jgi:hypothetical protein
MQHVNFDLSQLDNLDIANQGFSLSGSPGARTASPLQEAAIRAALKVAPGSTAGMMREAISIDDSPPPLSITPPTKVLVGSASTSPGTTPSAFTMGVGVEVSAFAVVGVTGGAGIYGSTTPELGLYATGGGGWWTNVGYSGGVTLTFILGAPADFAGVSWGIGADVRFMAGSFGGMLLFSPPPFRFLGIAVSLAAGPSAIPALDVTIQVSDTVTKPILK